MTRLYTGQSSSNRDHSHRSTFVAHVFIQWMAARGILDEWMDEVVRVNNHFDFSNLNDDMNHNTDGFIDMAFRWDDAQREGHDFWADVNDDWHDVLQALDSLPDEFYRI